MLDLTAKALPNTVEVDGEAFFIKTDYRVWIRFLRDAKTGQPFDVSYIFENEMPSYISVESLLWFAKPSKELPRPIRHSNAIALDYDLDADLIYSAFMEQYGIDLLDIEYLHWWKFIALLSGINEETKLGKVMGYRCYEKDNSKKDPYEELRKAWEIEPPMTQEEKEDAEELLRAFE